MKNMAEKVTHWMNLLEKLDELGYLSDANGIWNLKALLRNLLRSEDAKKIL